MLEAPWVKDPTGYEDDHDDEAYDEYYSMQEDEAWEEYLEQKHKGDKQ